MGGGGELESGGAPSGDRPTSVWARVQDHKIIQWGIGYLGAAFALAQGADVVGNAFDWPDVVGRSLILALVAGLPLQIGALAARFGDPDLAVTSFEETFSSSPGQIYAMWRPVYRDMRKLPRFKEFARQIGWPDMCRPFGENDFECD